MTVEGEQTEPAPRIVVEDASPLSTSMLWDLQRSFYDAAGLAAWTPDGVPHYITTNPSIARSYARTVFGFFRDLWSTPAKGKKAVAGDPVIVELGAGSGQFAYHFLRAFDALHSASPFADRDYTYVMTDFTRVNVDAWKERVRLQPFIDSGRLDFAIFDASAPGPIVLDNAAFTLGAGDQAGRPVVMIANYVLDSLPQDLLRTTPDGLVEHRVTVTSTQDEPDLAAPGTLDRLAFDWPIAPFEPDRHAADASVTALTDWYAENLFQAMFLLPVAAVRCLDHFRSLTGGPLLALVGDRGYDRLADLLADQGPQMGLHGGCFSLPVNFHALGLWAELHGGEVLTTRRGHSSLIVNAFICSMAGRSTAELRLAFTASVDEAGPDDFYAMQQIALGALESMDLDDVLAIIRWSAYDQVVFSAALPHLLVLVEAAEESAYGDIRIMLLRVWEAHYPGLVGLDVAFSIATILYGMEYYLDALAFLDRSLETAGPDPATFFNIGMAYYHLRQLELALENVRLAIEMSPTFAQARSMEAMIVAELAA